MSISFLGSFLSKQQEITGGENQNEVVSLSKYYYFKPSTSGETVLDVMENSNFPYVGMKLGSSNSEKKYICSDVSVTNVKDIEPLNSGRSIFKI